ncbi:MAG: hypothetical protein NXI32_13260 [bacterium]|nr:hypothetical protein [bacterium]
MKIKLQFLILLSLWAYASAMADEGYFQVQFQPGEQGEKLEIGVTFTLWIPEDTTRLRGIIVHQHGCGEGACRSGEMAAYDLHWQELARRWNCALLGPRYHQSENQDCRLWCDPRNGSAQVFVEALRELGRKSGHDELAEVPWCLWGHSGGGFWASIMQMLYPERIVAIWFQSGTAHSRWVAGEIEAPTISEAAMKIPMVANPGFKERGHERFHVAYDGSYAMVKDYRSRGAPIAFAPDPLSGHETRDSRYLAIPFFDACLALRLPDSGSDSGLKPIELSSGTYTPLHEDYSSIDKLGPVDGAADDASLNWLPNVELANKWAEFVTRGEVDDLTPPPAPESVSIAGSTLSWQARADFESGIRAFLVIKDGQEIGRVPAESLSRFGRPLFQGNTYHDTPAPDAPQMQFTDSSGRSGVYQVVAINTVGLRSEPSEFAKELDR